MKFFSRLSLFLSLVFLVLGVFTLLVFPNTDVTTYFFLMGSCIFLSLYLALDYKNLRANLNNPRARWSGLEVIKAVALLSLLLAVNWFAFKNPMKIDWSANRVHTLSPLSKKVVKDFTDPVEFTYFYVPSSDKKDTEDQVTLIVRKYQDENSKVSLRKINLLKDPGEAQRFGLRNQEEGFFVSYKDRRERFYKTDENSMTKALLRLTKGRKTIYFTDGYDEISVSDDGGKGFTQLAKELERLFYRVATIQLETEVIPEDAAAIVINAAERPFSAKVQAKIIDYFNSGGRIYIAVDPMGDPQKHLLEKFDLSVKKGIVHMEENELTGAGSHVVSGLLVRDKMSFMQEVDTESVAIFYVTAALQTLKNDKYEITPLIVSPGATVLRSGFTNKDPEIEKGAFSLMDLVQIKDKPGRLLVSGDSDLFSNQFLYQHLNPSLMFMVFSFLTNEEDLILKPAEAHSQEKFLVTDTSYKLFLTLFIIPLPIFFFVIAGFIGFRRRWM